MLPVILAVDMAKQSVVQTLTKEAEALSKEYWVLDAKRTQIEAHDMRHEEEIRR